MADDEVISIQVTSEQMRRAKLAGDAYTTFLGLVLRYNEEVPSDEILIVARPLLDELLRQHWNAIPGLLDALSAAP